MKFSVLTRGAEHKSDESADWTFESRIGSTAFVNTIGVNCGFKTLPPLSWSYQTSLPPDRQATAETSRVYESCARVPRRFLPGVQVPEYLEPGEVIKVNTETGEYMSRS